MAVVVPLWLRIIEEFAGVSVSHFATGIPASTLSGYFKGLYKPSLPRLKTLKSFSRKIQYIRLQGAGFPTKDARRWRDMSAENIDWKIDQVNTFVKDRAKLRDVDEEVIRNSMARSKKSIDDIILSP